MSQEQRTCLNCQSQFILESDDFEFYQKMKVPAPTRCPDCQLQSRLAYRNERTLYSRRDSIEGKNVISVFSPDKPLPVVSQEYWWSDKWDPLSYGKPYDFSKPFFVQFRELMESTPWPSLLNLNATNSEYCNYTTDNKNCYLVFGGDFNEDCAYGSFNMRTKDSMELYFVEKNELCYEVADSNDCYRVFFSQGAHHCAESFFLLNCSNLQNCIGCVNLRGKQYTILNVQYTKEEYQQKILELDLGNYQKLLDFQKIFQTFIQSQPHRFAQIVHGESSSGNNLEHVKNCVNCFDVINGAEDCKNVVISGWGLKDTRNSDHSGHTSELIYNTLGAFSGSSKVLCSLFIASSFEISYSISCRGSSNLFGCVGLRQKSFCILNKQYTEQEYNELVPKIIEHMNTMPYIDSQGKNHVYGDYFPMNYSPYCYNESVAQEYFPLTKEEVISKGYYWKDSETQERKMTLMATSLPVTIKEVSDTILNELIGCEHAGACLEQCTSVYKITPHELDFYRRINLPLPHLCPNCRHYQRFKKRNPIKLRKRACGCNGSGSKNSIYMNAVAHAHTSNPCSNEFETTYSPDRPEIVYCEACYQSEVL